MWSGDLAGPNNQDSAKHRMVVLSVMLSLKAKSRNYTSSDLVII